VTGGAGFIGSNLVHRLAQDGHEVVVVDNLSTGHAENLSGLDGRVTLIRQSICKTDALRTAFSGVGVVFHQAALASVPRSISDPLATNSSNVDGTLSVLVAAKDAGVKRVVMASSSSVYGNAPLLPKREDMQVDPLSPYAVSKYASELYARVFAGAYGLETVVLRYFNVFGPRQDPSCQYAAVIPRFIAAMLMGNRPTVFGDGERSRDFTFVENVVQANLLAASAPGISGEVFNVGCGGRYSLNSLVQELNKILGVQIEPEYEASRPGDVQHSLASIEKAYRCLGYKPLVSFEEGLKRTVDWFRSRP
jgi:UDP-glucose 4-epimerase